MRISHLRIDPVVLVVGIVMGAGLAGLGHVVPGFLATLGVVSAGLATPATVQLLRRRALLPPAGTPERDLVQRARTAVRTARRVARRAPAGPLAERSRVAAMQLEPSLEGISRLALQSVAVRNLAAGINPKAGQRLTALSGDLRQRTEALVASLESVVAGLIEALALAGTDPGGQALIALERVSAEVEGLRSGLQEAQSLSRSAALMEVMEVKS